MANNLSGFYKGETKNFSVKCKFNGIAQNITEDEVVFRMKNKKDKSDSEADLIAYANVAEEGINGVAIFTLRAPQTSIPEGTYFCDIVWTWSSGEEYVIYDGVIKVLERVSDVMM